MSPFRLVETLRLLLNQVEVQSQVSYDFLSGLPKLDDLESADLADLGFFCREIENTLDDWRKTTKAFKEKLSSVLAMRIMQDPANLNAETAEDTVRGKFASAKADLKVFAELPKRGTANYDMLLNFFGVKGDTELIKPDWQAMKREVTRRAEMGEPQPPGLGKQYPEYTVIYRRK